MRTPNVNRNIDVYEFTIIEFLSGLNIQGNPNDIKLEFDEPDNTIRIEVIELTPKEED